MKQEEQLIKIYDKIISKSYDEYKFNYSKNPYHIKKGIIKKFKIEHESLICLKELFNEYGVEPQQKVVPFKYMRIFKGMSSAKSFVKYKHLHSPYLVHVSLSEGDLVQFYYNEKVDDKAKELRFAFRVDKKTDEEITLCFFDNADDFIQECKLNIPKINIPAFKKYQKLKMILK